MADVIDPRHFRNILGHYPTGVSVVTSVDNDGLPVGMSVGSFTSVSLDPPLVAFLPAMSSSTWPKIKATAKFGVNILADNQHDLCAGFAKSGGAKFSGVSHRLSANGTPVIDGIAAWIECELYAVYEAGDHEIALGRVIALSAHADKKPLLVFKGGYGGFMSLPPQTSAKGC